MSAPVRLVDLSLPLEPSPSERVPVRVDRCDHAAGGRQLAGALGVPAAALPGGIGWASEQVSSCTHAGTHMDAPWHYGPRSGEAAARTIDQVPVEWCCGHGVVLDFTAKGDGDEVTCADLRRACAAIGHLPGRGDIVLLRTGADRYWGRADYPERGCGLGRESTFWLLGRGVRVIGTDAWGLDRPFGAMRAEWAQRRDPQVLWAAHCAGREREYCQLEKLTGLDRVPPLGATILCFPIKIAGASAGWVRAVALLGGERTPRRGPGEVAP